MDVDIIGPLRMVEKKLENAPIARDIVNDFQQLLRKINSALESLDLGKERAAKFGQELGNSGITAGYVIQKALATSDIEDIVDVKCNILSSDGFLSKIIQIVASFDENTANCKMIVKIPETKTIAEAVAKTLGNKSNKYFGENFTEENFARSLVNVFNREICFYAKNDIPGLAVPKVFYSQQWMFNRVNGALVMEDLSHMRAVELYDCLSLDQVTAVSSQIKALQVYSKTMNRSWVDDFSSDRYNDCLSKMEDMVELFVEKNPCLRNLFERFRKTYQDKEFIENLILNSHTDIGVENVLVHGDLWSYNIMWETDENRKASAKLGALIDWQRIHLGSTGEDFAHLLGFCCDADVRRQAEQEFLPQFHKELCEAHNAAGNEYTVTLEQYLRAYNRSFIIHALHFPFLAHVMLTIKSTDELEQQRRNKVLVERTLEGWKDALERLEQEYPERMYTTLINNNNC